VNDLTAPSRVLFETPLVRVGQFRCPVFHPLFANSGPTRTHCFVFPRTPVWIEHEGQPPFVADPNVVPLYNPGHPYARRAIGPRGDRTDWFGISPALLREVIGEYDPGALDSGGDLFRLPAGRADARTYLSQRAVFDRVRSGAAEVMWVEESDLALLASVLDATCGRRAVDANRRHRDIAEDARAQLNLTFVESRTLDDLAQAVGTSVFHLCRIFRQHTGTTIHQYRAGLRLRRAIELLHDGGDILAVAMALGYSGHSHFTRAFHRAFGITPSRLRGGVSAAYPRAGAQASTAFTAAGLSSCPAASRRVRPPGEASAVETSALSYAPASSSALPAVQRRSRSSPSCTS